MTQPKKNTSKTSSKNFETAMQRLEEITDKMQETNISLEDALRYYEEGIELMAFCQQKLKQVQQKIEILNSKNNELEVFELNE